MLQDRRAGCQQTCRLLTLNAFIYLIFHLCILCHYSIKPQWNDWIWNGTSESALIWMGLCHLLIMSVFVISDTDENERVHFWGSALNSERNKPRGERRSPTNKIINSCQRRETRPSGAERVVSGGCHLWSESGGGWGFWGGGGGRRGDRSGVIRPDFSSCPDSYFETLANKLHFRVTETQKPLVTNHQWNLI